jgi:SAM-dependent methyltransferase
MHQNTLLLFNRYAKQLFPSGASVLEVGPGFYPSQFYTSVADPTVRWDTIDIFESPNLTYSTTDPYRFPIPDDSYDVVFAANVLEHVPAIWRWIKEVARVCKTGGRVITINPVNWAFHQFPVDCWRAYPDGMKALYDDAGLDVELSKAESLESRRNRINPHGLKLLIKAIVGVNNTGEPFIPLDTISIGRKR